MQTQYIIAIAWFMGFLLSRWMLKVEHQAEGNEYTNGDEINEIILSLLSFAMVMFMLIKAWGSSVKKYWSKPVSQPDKTKNNQPG